MKLERKVLMKKLTAMLLAALMLTGVVSANAEVEVKLIVDDKIVDADVITENNRTLVPLRAIMENAGAEVQWYADTKKIDVKRGDKTITLQIGNNIMNTPEGDKIMDVVPAIYGVGTTYLPIRAVCEEFTMNVDWDGGTKTVLINTPDGCPYVDMYNGATVEEYAKERGITNEELASLMLMDYKDVAGKKVAEASNMTPILKIAEQNGVTEKELEQVFEVEVDEKSTLGYFVGEMTLKHYLNYIGIAQYYPSIDQAMADFKREYSLGEEYTLDTKFKYVRTLVDTYALKQIESEQMAEEQLKLEAEARLPELTKNKLGFKITMNDGSVMKGELYPDLAPITVENFKKLANSGFYNGLIFHRVIDGCMIQGGGYDKNMQEKEAEAIKGEFIANGILNGLLHEKGVISMARTNDSDSASSQFFIMDETTPTLDGMYAAFGRITEGLDVVNKISEVETGNNEIGMSDVPVKPVVIKSIVVD